MSAQRPTVRHVRITASSVPGLSRTPFRPDLVFAALRDGGGVYGPLSTWISSAHYPSWYWWRASGIGSGSWVMSPRHCKNQEQSSSRSFRNRVGVHQVTSAKHSSHLSAALFASRNLVDLGNGSPTTHHNHERPSAAASSDLVGRGGVSLGAAANLRREVSIQSITEQALPLNRPPRSPRGIHGAALLTIRWLGFRPEVKGANSSKGSTVNSRRGTRQDLELVPPSV